MVEYKTAKEMQKLSDKRNEGKLESEKKRVMVSILDASDEGVIHTTVEIDETVEYAVIEFFRELGYHIRWTNGNKYEINW